MKKIFLREEIVSNANEQISFAVLTDVHNENVDEILSITNSLKVDAFLVVGDLFESPPRRNYTKDSEAIRLLNTLKEQAPVFYSIGNHDLTPSEKMIECLSSSSIFVLDNSFMEFHNIKIGGWTSQSYKNKRDFSFPLSFSQEEGYKLLLSHHPEYYEDTKDLPIDLIVSGHAHGGMWELFGHGVFSPGQGLFPKYTKGIYDGKLVVSRGLKTSGIIKRFHNPPEIILLKIQNS